MNQEIGDILTTKKHLSLIEYDDSIASIILSKKKQYNANKKKLISIFVLFFFYFA
jgi:hypothetical protein